jgi:hypothetical protein
VIIYFSYCKISVSYSFSFSSNSIFRSNQLYKFFLHWRPERQLDPLIDDEDLQTNLDESKYNDNSTNKGFVLLATDDPQLTDDYIPTKKTKNSIQQKKELHYLKRQNTLLKEWEVRLQILDMWENHSFSITNIIIKNLLTVF